MRLGDPGENWAALENKVLVEDTGSLLKPGVERSALREVTCALGDAAFEALVMGNLGADPEQVPSHTSTGEAAIYTDHP